MDNKTVFIKTSKGDNEIKGKGGGLSGDFKRALFLVDDKATFEEISKRAAPSLREALPDVFKQLVREGYVLDKAKSFATPQIATPKIITPDANGELDFTGLATPPKPTEPSKKETEAARARAELEAAVEAAKIKARAEAEAKAEASAKLAADLAAKNKMAAEAQAKQEAVIKAQAEAKAKQEAEARIRAEQAAIQTKMQLEAARVKTELEAAAKAKAEAEAARLKAEQETAKIRAELAAATAKAEAEAKALAEERAKQKAEHDAAKAKAEAEARIHAEQAAAQAKIQLEAARVKAELEAAAKAKAEAKEARLKAEQETARVRSELAAATAKAAAEAKALAEQHAKQEAEHAAAKAKTEAEARMHADQAATQAKIQLEADRAKAELETASKAKAAADEARLKAEQETAKVKAELEAARAEAETGAKVLAEEHAKQEAEALRSKAAQKAETSKVEIKPRAIEQRPKETVSPAAIAATPHPAAMPEKRSRAYRKPLPLAKMAAGLFVLALLSIPVLPYVIPLNSYIAPIELKLSTQFNQPVHLKTLHAALLPWPKLELVNVTIGAEQEVKIGAAIVTFDFLSLLADSKTIRSLELNDIRFEASTLGNELTWLQAVGNNRAFPVKQITLQHAQLANSELALPPFSGEIDIGAQGNVEQLALKSEDAKIDITLLPTANAWQISLNAKKSSLPVLGNMLLDDFSAKGEVIPAGINFPAIEAQAYGGFLQGNAKLNWKDGWQLQGKVTARSVELDKLFPQFGVAGALAGESSFSYSAKRLNQLAETRQLAGSFVVKKGRINGMDMVETARQGNPKNASSGRTHFDELSGNFQMNSHGPHFQQLKIKSGILNGNGSFDVNPGSQISGRLQVELKAREGVSALSLSGTLTAPILRY